MLVPSPIRLPPRFDGALGHGRSVIQRLLDRKKLVIPIWREEIDASCRRIQQVILCEHQTEWFVLILRLLFMLFILIFLK